MKYTVKLLPLMCIRMRMEYTSHHLSSTCPPDNLHTFRSMLCTDQPDKKRWRLCMMLNPRRTLSTQWHTEYMMHLDHSSISR